MALVRSTVVKRIEGDEVVFERQQWTSESSDNDDDDGDGDDGDVTTSRRLEEDEQSETENWD